VRKQQKWMAEIALTTDGAKLEGKLCHVMSGFKLVNVNEINPNTVEKVLKICKVISGVFHSSQLWQKTTKVPMPHMLIMF
jgi:hypothetical protein